MIKLNFKNWIITTFGLKGSWKWAKKQMLKGEVVAVRLGSEYLVKLRIEPRYVYDIDRDMAKLSGNLEECNHQGIWIQATHNVYYEDMINFIVLDLKN